MGEWFSEEFQREWVLRASSHNIAMNVSRKGQSDGACGWSVVQLQESEGWCLLSGLFVTRSTRCSRNSTIKKADLWASMVAIGCMDRGAHAHAHTDNRGIPESRRSGWRGLHRHIIEECGLKKHGMAHRWVRDAWMGSALKCAVSMLIDRRKKRS